MLIQKVRVHFLPLKAATKPCLYTGEEGQCAILRQPRSQSVSLFIPPQELSLIPTFSSNVKLSGTNSILSPASLGTIVSQSTMVFGADVTHPAPGSLSPSIAAVVGTMDNALTLYGTSIRLQPCAFARLSRQRCRLMCVLL